MFLTWIEWLGALAGALGIVLAFVLGFRSSQSSQPKFDLLFGDVDPTVGGFPGSLIVRNPGRQPIIVRSMIVERPRDVRFVVDGGPDQVADAMPLNVEIPPVGEDQIDFFVLAEDAAQLRKMSIEVEYVDGRFPTQTISESVEGRLLSDEPKSP